MAFGRHTIASRRALAALLTTTALGLASAAVAQEDPAATQPAAALPSGTTAVAESGDIIVTAQKRTQRLQDVPISIQVLGQQNLEERQVKGLDDYTRLLPSVSYQSFGPGQSQLYVRGITTGADGLRIGPQPTTGIYLDEIPVTTIGNSVDLHIFDVSRVEALNGPQGTLFGASSEAGTLRIITNKPDPSGFSAGYQVEGNKFGKGDAGGVANAFVNVPLGDRAAIRLVGFYEHDGGYIDNTFGERTYTLGDSDDTTNKTINNRALTKKNFNDVDNYGGRIALKYDISDTWSVTPQVIAQHQKSNGNFLYDPKVGDLQVHDFYGPEYNKDKWYQASLTVQGKLSNWDVTYAGSYFQRQVKNYTDYTYYSVAYDSYLGSYATYFPTGDPANPYLDPSQQQYLQDDYTKQTHELRVSSPAGERLRLTAGLFFERQTDKVRADYYVSGIANNPPNDLTYISPIPGFGDDVYATRAKRTDRDYAAFGELSFDILPSLTLTGGIRGYMFKNTLKGASGFGALSFYNTKNVDSGETHKLNLTWKVDRDHMVYATYSTGFRPGGANRIATVTQADGSLVDTSTYNTDTLDNYEVGFKTGWLNNRLHVNGAVFYEKWNKPQISYSPAGLNGVTITQNIPGARSKGVEADATLNLGPLSLAASGTYIDAHTKGAFESNRGITPSGTRLPVQPKFKISGNARYTFHVGELKPFIQASTLHQTSSRSLLFTDQFNNVGTLKGFTTFDFAAGTSLPHKMSVELYIQNAFDKRGQLSRNTACSPSLTVCADNYRIYPVKPQLFGVRVSQNF